MNILFFIVVGVLSGWLAGRVSRDWGTDIAGDMAIGVFAAIIVGELFGVIDARSDAVIDVLLTTGAAMALTMLIGVLERGKAKANNASRVTSAALFRVAR